MAAADSSGLQQVQIEPEPTQQPAAPLSQPVPAEKVDAPKQQKESAPKIGKKKKEKAPEDSDVHPDHRKRSDRYLYLLVIVIIGLLLAVVYYYKMILHKPLPIIGSVISTVQAQTITTPEKKTGKGIYEVLEVDGIKFHPFVDFRGFQLKPLTSTPPEECSKLDSFGVKMHFILQGKMLSEEWKKFRDKCSFKIAGEIGALVEYRAGLDGPGLDGPGLDGPGLDGKVEEKPKVAFKDFITPYKLGKKKLARVLSIYKIVEKQTGEKSYPEIFLKISSEKFDEKKSKKLDALRRYLNSVNDSDNVYAVLSRLFIALEWGNHSWAKREIKNLIHLNPLRYIYSIQLRGDEKKINQLKISLNNLVKKAFEVEKIKQEVRLLVANFSLFMEGDDIKQLVDDLEANWSLADLRRLSREGRRGREYFEFWYSSLKGRTTQNEILSYFQRSLNPDVIREMSPHSLWVFSEYLPNDKNERAEIIERGIKLGKTDDTYFRFVVFGLTTQEPLKKAISPKISWMKGATFNIKRSLHSNSLNNGEAINYSIYNLLKMGDKNEEFLWWLALNNE